MAMLSSKLNSQINLNNYVYLNVVFFVRPIPAFTESDMTHIFLGGACNPTTWRRDVAIPAFRAVGLSYFNPQVDEWREELVEIEAEAKAKADILLFVVSCETRSIASMIEVTEYIVSGRVVVLVVEDISSDTVIDGHKLSPGEVKDLTRARVYLADVANRHAVNVFKTVEEAVSHIVANS